MPVRPDTPRIARRRMREQLVISQMIAIWCAGHHPADERTETAHCGTAICPACANLDRAAQRHTANCPHMADKTSCQACARHCYPPKEAQAIRAVMRYAGPRMVYRHPVAAIRHILGR